MHGLIGLLLIGYAAFTAALSPVEHNPAHQVNSGNAVSSARVIVKLKTDSALLYRHTLSRGMSRRATVDVMTARATALGSRMGIALKSGRAIDEHTQVLSTSELGSAALVQRLEKQDDVEYAVIDRRRAHMAYPNDSLFLSGPPIASASGGPKVGQWYLRPPTSEILSSVNAMDAWVFTTGHPGIIVAVLDSGIRPEHPDLSEQLLPGYDMVSNVLAANDSDGRDSSGEDPGDWITAAESTDKTGEFYECDAENSTWHGTMTSSLIAATTNNGIGMVGVAWGTRLLPVRVLGKCGGFDSDIIAGIRWAAGLSVPGAPINPTPARVINMSLGSSGPCNRVYSETIGALLRKSAPIVVVASAGNSSGLAVGAPANCPGVIAVAGLRHVGTKVGFSDLGPEITISAPGGNCVNIDSGSPCLYPILAATNTGQTTPLTSTYSDSFNASVGTSFSAPLVSGAVALMLSINPNLTPEDLKFALQQSARPFPQGDSGSISSTDIVPECHAPDDREQLECICSTSTCGAGMLDVAAAVARVQSLSGTPFIASVDCVFDWAEHEYPQLFASSSKKSIPTFPYYYRYYADSGNYLAVSAIDNHAWLYGPQSNNELLDLGSIAVYMAAAGCAVVTR